MPIIAAMKIIQSKIQQRNERERKMNIFVKFRPICRRNLNNGYLGNL